MTLPVDRRIRPGVAFHEPHVRLIVCRYRLLPPGCGRGKSAVWRIYHNDAEGVFYRFGGRTYPVVPGEITAVPPHTLAERTIEQQVGHFFLHISCARTFLNVRPHLLQFTPSAETLRYIEELKPIVHEAADRRHFGAIESLKMQAIAHSVLSHLDPDLLEHVERDERIDRAIELIEQEFPNAIRNDRLAATAFMSRNAFIRLFTRLIGVSPQRYIIDRRLERADSLLRYTDLPVAEIAEECGFGNRTYFSRAYKLHRGVSPAQFRKNKDLR